MRFTRNQILGVFVVIIVVAAGVIGWQLTGEDEPEEQGRQILTGQVERRTLRDELTVSGELRRDELATINSPFDGRVSQIGVEDGDTIRAGDELLALDGRPAVAVQGEFSFYRRLDVGSDGPDVLQLERILLESGYDPGAVDRLYTEATRAALREWQIAYGYGGATPEPEETLVVSLAAGSGYTVADKDTTALIIGPSVPAQTSGSPDLVPTLSGGGGGAAFTPAAPTLAQGDPLPRIGVEVGEVTIDEGQTIDIVLIAEPAPTDDIEVTLSFGGDATGGDLDDAADPDIDIDYIDDPLEDTSLIWPAGETSVELEFRSVTDDLDEDDEEWTVAVAPGLGTNYEVGPIKTTTVTIVDTTDPKIPTLTLRVDEDDREIEEGEAATFTVESDMELDTPIEVRYTVGGSATEEDDYDEQDDDPTFEFVADDTKITFAIGTIRDDDIEPDETITVTLLEADDPDSQYFLGPSITGTVTIEDESEPELTMITRETRVPEGASVDVIIEADQAPNDDISVDYTIAGTATMGIDFNTVTGSVTLPAGQTRVALTIDTIDDDVIFIPSDMIVGDWPARVGTVFVDEGETVQLGQELLTLTEPEFTITLFANPTDRSELQLGQAVTVEIEAGNQESTGIITRLDDTATISESGGESYEGVVEVDDELLAVDGANVSIEVVLEERVDALVVPIAAISQDATGNDIVRVVDPDTRIATDTPIVAGLQEGSFTEVVSGLSGGEIIIIDVRN